MTETALDTLCVETFGFTPERVVAAAHEALVIWAGKCLPVTTTEVIVTLKRPPLLHRAQDELNTFRFRLGPDAVIALGARVKRPVGIEVVARRMMHELELGSFRHHLIARGGFRLWNAANGRATRRR